MACSYGQTIHLEAGDVKYNIAKKEAKNFFYSGPWGGACSRPNCLGWLLSPIAATTHAQSHKSFLRRFFSKKRLLLLNDDAAV
jgi:hypothetical protein